LKIREIVRKLKEDGWYHHSTRDSHRQFEHLSKSGRVTVPGQPGDELAVGTVDSIYKQTGWKQVQL